MSELNLNTPTHIELTADIVSAFVSKNAVEAAALPALIKSVYAALSFADSGVDSAQAAAQEALKPAVNPKKSVFPEFIICLEDGKKFKSLKRHLGTSYKMTPEQYREKWGLAADYPMVAPSYSSRRSSLAKQIGLGQKRRRAA
jgi:predicted transcriptional regulator